MILSVITQFLAILLISTALTLAGPVKPPSVYTNKHNRLDCPAAHASKWTGPQNGKWGILCGMDTQSTSYYKGPLISLTFEECILKCGSAEFDCNVATYTSGRKAGQGTCYLKKSTKGMGYRKTGDGHYKVAIRLRAPDGSRGEEAPRV